MSTDTTTWSEELYRIFGVDAQSSPPGFALHPPLFTPESWPVLQTAVARTLKSGEPYCVELAYRRMDADAGGWLEACGEAIRDAQGAIVGLRGTAQEISDRRRARHAETQARARAHAAHDRVLLLRAFSQSIRTSLNAVLGFAYMLKNNVAKDGAQGRWVDQILTASQQIVAVMEKLEAFDRVGANGLDPSASVAAPSSEEATSLTMERLQTLLELVPCPVLIYNRDGEILHVSRALTETTGYTPDELPTRAAWAARAYRDDDAIDISSRIARAFVARTVADGGERWITTKTGEKRLWHLFAAPTPTAPNGEPLFVSLGIDVTAQHGESHPV